MVIYEKLGSRLHFIYNKGDRFRTEINFIFTAGGAYFESQDESGLSHFLEHTVVARNKKYDFYELKDYLFKHDIYSNASTGNIGMYLINSGHKLDIDKMTDLILEFALEPTLTDDTVNREREIILREISQRNGDPNYILQKKVLDEILEPESAALTDILGKPEVISSANINELKKLHSTIIDRSHFIVTISGGIEEIDKIREKFLKITSKIKITKKLQPVSVFTENKYKKFRYKPIINELAHEHSILNLLIPCEVTMENRPERVFILDLFLRVPDGLLYNRLRNELGFIYGLNSYYDQTSNNLLINMTCEFSYITEIVKETKKFLSDFPKYFNKEKAKILKESMIKKQELLKDDLQDSIDFIVNNLMDYGVPGTFDEYSEQFRNVDNRAIKKVYDSISSNLNKMQIVVVSKDKQINSLKF